LLVVGEQSLIEFFLESVAYRTHKVESCIDGVCMFSFILSGGRLVVRRLTATSSAGAVQVGDSLVLACVP
jgi:hypothetical protein